MKIYLYLILLSVTITFTCCSFDNDNITTDSSREIICDISSANSTHKLSEICDSVTLIPLETSDKAFVGIINKIIVDSECMYFLSKNKIFIYNKHGKFLRTISSIGHALNEFVEINDFCISKSHIFVSDIQSKKILIFTKKGDYKKTIKTIQFPEYIASINDSTLAISCSGTEGYRIVILDTYNEKIKNGHFKYTKRFSSPIPQVFTYSAEKLLYKQPFSNKYYHICKDATIEEAYSIDFKKYTFQENDLGELDFGGCKIPYDTKGNADIIRFNETSLLYQIEFSCERLSKESQFIMLIDKNTNNRVLINSATFKDDITYYDHRILPDFSYQYEECFWGIIYPAAWKDCIKKVEISRKGNSTYKGIIKYLESISDEQNPIICVYHIKKSLQ